jgi:hypothetical protein
MNIGEAKKLTGGGLGHPSKMPGTSYGISAHNCITGSKLAKIVGSVCHGCYALKANYNYSSVKTAHARRLASITGPHWTAAMVLLITHSGTKYHRWHDSGDLQSIEHLTKICAVAALTHETVRYWLPTRELSIVLAYKAQGGIVPSNLVIRVSDTMIDGKVTKAWPTTSGVHTKATKAWGKARAMAMDWLRGVHVCPSPKYNNTCGPCRACWSVDVPRVSYHKH